MSTKSYTLADSTTATVNATANGVEFNEGMGALTKAIKAKITASSGGGSTPTVTLKTKEYLDPTGPLGFVYTTIEGGIRVYDGSTASSYLDITYELS